MREPERRIVKPTLGIKDDSGAYVPIPDVAADLDSILAAQLKGLAELTKHICTVIKQGPERETAQQLATCIKITMELKAKENELLDDLSDEELAKVAETE